MTRPITYSIDDVLEKAMLAFWRHGYRATSLDNLTSVTGLGKSSLYNTFGDKRSLYIRSLEFYANREVTAAIAMLKMDGQPRNIIGSLLKTVIERIVKSDDRLGCLLCNTAMDIGASDGGIASLVRQHFQPLQQAFFDLLHLNGLDEEKSKSQAQQLLAIYTGLQVMSRTGYSELILQNIIEQTVSQLP